MSESYLRKSFLLILFLLVYSLEAICGWVITEVSTDAFGNKNMQTTFIQGNLIRHETISSIAIVDLEKKEITIIFSQYRVFWKGTITELKKSTVEAYDKQMEEMLVGLPREVRMELDSIYKGIRVQMLDTTYRLSDANIAVLNSGQTEDILGYNCTKYNITVDDKLSESVWHTKDVKPYNDLNIKNMISFMKQMNSFSGQNISQTSEYIDLLAEGLLLKSAEYSQDTIVQTVEVTNIREVGIPLDFFRPPPGYSEATFSDILNLMPVVTEEMDKW